MIINITVKQLATYLSDKDFLCIDIREQWEYASGHIPKAINMPLSTFDIKKLPKDKKIILYCKSGIRSAFLAKQIPFTVYHLKEGMQEWIKAKFPETI